ncbi:MAG: GTP-binding protein [Bacteroidota bacterium]
MDLLRFATAGSVDDGKSTLIGRLLHDTGAIPDDLMSAVELAGQRRGEKELNLALFTDGLRAEREQGITIDVAYRYFSTPERKFILADSPGHVQYTRNMVTAISNVSLVILMVDALRGITEQTKRHACLSAIFGIRHLIVCVNKMDLVSYSEPVFNNIKAGLGSFLESLHIPDVRFVPVSALKGDNIANSGTAMPWYSGNTLLSVLENTTPQSDNNYTEGRLPIQGVIRNPDAAADSRFFSGRIAGGIWKPGDRITVLPSGALTKIKSIYSAGTAVSEAFPQMSVSISTETETDISRGDMLALTGTEPILSRDFDVMLCWLDRAAYNPVGRLLLKHCSTEAKVAIREIKHKTDISSLTPILNSPGLNMNDIALVSLRSSKPLCLDTFNDNRITGSLILIDEATNNTVAACIVVKTNIE